MMNQAFSQKGIRPAPRPQTHSHRLHSRSFTCKTATTQNANVQQTLTQRMFQAVETRTKDEQQALGAGGGTTYQSLKNLDAAWLDLRTKKIFGPPPTFVKETSANLATAPEYDVVVAGGTLGIFLATALQVAGLKVAVMERGPLQGRAQEWNISRKELLELVELGIFTEEEMEDCIRVEFNPVRVGFYQHNDVWTKDALNLGVSPAKLIETARKTFEAAGGTVLDRTVLNGVTVHGNSVNLAINNDNSAKNIQCRLLVDSMGNQSPIVRQIRFGQKPDGVCLVVGSCCRGPFEENTTGDVIYTASPSESAASSLKNAGYNVPGNLQLYWEAFPAGSGPKDRTTYMFTYLDADPKRPAIEDLMELYWNRMPEYQNVNLDDVEVLRILFGLFPTYRDSPLSPAFDRIIQVGDAGGLQSPLSFGGFAALSRHLPRLTRSLKDAIECNAVNKQNLALINAYSPALSGAWMMQRAMSIQPDLASYDVNFINKLLGDNFAVMAKLGDATLKPFLQDVIQAGPLTATLGKQMISDPLFIPQIFARVGFGALGDWLMHYLGLVTYTALSMTLGKYLEESVVDKLPKKSKQRFLVERAIDNWKYGAGLDYRL